MLEKYSHEDLIRLAEQIAMRYAVGDHRISNLGNLMLFLKYSVNWRLSLFSNDALQRLWDAVALKAGDPELVMSMTSEFVFRAKLVQTDNGYISDSSVYQTMATSLAWPSKAKALSDELRTYVSDTTTYSNFLKDNPWAMFLYLLSMSDTLERTTLASTSFAKQVAAKPEPKQPQSNPPRVN